MLGKKIGILLLSAMLAVTTAIPAMADTQSDIAQAQAQKDAAESNLNSTNSTIASLQGEKADLTSYLSDLNGQITELTNSLNDVSAQIETKKAEIEQAKTDVTNARIAEETQYDDMETRIQYMYENGQDDLLTTMAKSSSISDFINRVDEIRQMQAYDRQCLEEYKSARQAVEDRENQLLMQQESLTDLQTQQQDQMTQIQTLADTTNAKIDEYVQKISAQESIASDLQSQIENQKSLLSDLAAKAAAEAEAKRKAEEEAAAALAAQKAAAQAEADRLAQQAAEDAKAKAAKAVKTAASTSSSSENAGSSDTSTASKDTESSASSDSGTSSTDTGYSQSDLELIWAIVAQEDDQSYTGALAVISCAMNRADRNYGGYGTTALAQLTANNQFCYSPSISASIYWQRRLGGNVPDYVKEAVSDCLTKGIRNHSFLYFRSSNRTGNYTQIGGNWFF